MRRLAMVLPTVAMLFCLAAYGITNAAQARKQVTPPLSNQPMQPLKPMSMAEMTPNQADSLRDRRQAVSHAAQLQEDLIIKQLGLSVQQMTAYTQLRQSIDQQTPPEDPAEAAAVALQTSARFRAALQDILTAEQYRQYRELWSHHQGVYGSVKSDAEMNPDDDVVGSTTDASTPPE